MSRKRKKRADVSVTVGGRTRPKFKAGQRVTYRGNRRLRRIVLSRYWDSKYPGWRYRINEKGLRADIAAAWAVIEHELLAVKP